LATRACARGVCEKEPARILFYAAFARVEDYCEESLTAILRLARARVKVCRKALAYLIFQM
jgi:hypothetical protein